MAKSLIEKMIAIQPRGRTIEQLAAELGCSVQKLKTQLEKPALPSGYELAHWVDHIGEKRFDLLIPETPHRSPDPRAFRFIRSRYPESYIRVFIPDDIKDSEGKPAKLIELQPFSDVHWGHERCDQKSFLLDVKDVARRPNRFSIWNGDMMDNSLGDSAGGAAWAEQKAHPKQQREQLQTVFLPIAHKTLSATSGNHEERSEKKTLMNPLEEICRGLSVPYFAGPYNLEIIWRGYRWTFFMKHGTGNSNTPGGKVNNAARDRNYNDFRNFFCSGHVHDEVSDKIIRAVRHREFENGKLKRFWVKYLKEYIVIFPSYLLYSDTYAERAGYSPGSRNTLLIQLFANGDYHVVTSKRKNDGETEKIISEEIL